MRSAQINPAITPITLENLAARHAEAIAQWMTDPDLRENMGIRSIPTLASTRQWLMDCSLNKDKLAFAILWGKWHVGNLIFDRFDPNLGTARLHIYLGKAEAKGKGLAGLRPYGLVWNTFSVNGTAIKFGLPYMNAI